MTAFFVIGFVGLALLVVTLVAGEVVEGLVDGIGGEWFSGAGLAGFVGAFGFAGALAFDASDSLAIGIVVGLAAGVLIGALVALGTRYLQRGGTDANVRTASLVGRAGSVSTPVPAAGYGEITLVAAGHITRLNARSATPLDAGTAVTITQVLSATAVMVEPVAAVQPRVGPEVPLADVPPTPPPAADEPDPVPPEQGRDGSDPGERGPGEPGPGERGPGFEPPPSTWTPWDDADRRS